MTTPFGGPMFNPSSVQFDRIQAAARQGAQAWRPRLVGRSGALAGCRSRCEFGELIDAGRDKIVVNQLREMRGKTSGANVAWSFWIVLTFRDGRVLRWEWFADRDEALEAARVTGPPKRSPD
jgi:ketosteroid isomerase-like protein